MDGILLLLVVFGVMMIPMLLMSNRQRKLQRQQQEMVAQLGVGDEVRTHSGFYGLIVESYGEVVVLETESGALTKWARAAIATRVDADGAPVTAGSGTAAATDAAHVGIEDDDHAGTDREDDLADGLREDDGYPGTYDADRDSAHRAGSPSGLDDQGPDARGRR